MYVTGRDVSQVRHFFARQPLPVLRSLRNKLAHELLDSQAQAAYAVLLGVIAGKEARASLSHAA
jgi:hypothetical protein